MKREQMKENHSPFNWPHMTGKELYYIAEPKFNGRLVGDGPLTKRCHRWLEERTECNKASLKRSSTAALEVAALLLEIQPCDEVIMPSFIFVATANAFVLRGTVPIFVHVRADALNLDERLIEAAIPSRTRAISPVHHADVASEMDAMMGIARKAELLVVEDTEQWVVSRYKGNALGQIGDPVAFSFHETKNVTSGEGGALSMSCPEFALCAERICKKGTDRSRFCRCEVDKYSWQEAGSSYLPGELTAAVLWAQMEEADAIAHTRLACWDFYPIMPDSFEQRGLQRRPIIASEFQHATHMYYELTSAEVDCQRVVAMQDSALTRSIAKVNWLQ